MTTDSQRITELEATLKAAQLEIEHQRKQAVKHAQARMEREAHIARLREALEASKCRCSRALVTVCRECGGELVAGVEQFADSWICPTCKETKTPESCVYQVCDRCVVLAESPAASLEAIRGPVSSTYGDLVAKSEYLSQRIVNHEWDNKTPSEQRDWVIDEIEAIRAEAGRERAVAALRSAAEQFDSRAFHVQKPAEWAFMEARDECRKHADEIEREGQS